MKHIVIGTAGHIDHGKSALVEALTGIDPDRLKEEKVRGITIDLGFAHYQYRDTELAFVDVPGHERFVRNMLAGASGIDGVLMVIAADESVMPQTREHFDICHLLGVTGGVIALTKTDIVDNETIELVRLETQELVSGSFLEGMPVVPVSARSGAGLPELREALAALAHGVVGRKDDGVPRIPVDRAFTLKGFGTVVTGTQVAGRIERETELALLPANRRVKIRGLQVHGKVQAGSRAGQRVAINLSGIEVDDIRRGDTLTSPGGMRATARIDSRIVLLRGARELKYGARVRFHQGTTEVMARIALGAVCEGTTDGTSTFPAALGPGMPAFARLHLERPAAVTRGDRFVLRTYSPPLTIAGGVVLDPSPLRGRLRSHAGYLRLRRLDRGDTDATAMMVLDAGGEGVTPSELVPRVGLPLKDVDRIMQQLLKDEIIVAVGERVVSAEQFKNARDALVAAVSSYHRTHPLESGLPRQEARERLARIAGVDLFQHLVNALAESGTLLVGRHLALSTHRVVLSDDEAAVKAQLVTLFRNSGLTPPDAMRWATDEGVGQAMVDRMVTLLVHEGHLERVDTLVFHRETLVKLRADVTALKKGQDGPVRLDVADFKASFRISRKYAIPLLEYLDGVRVTRRVGRDRVVM